jgi:hypothetical protein
MIKFGDVVDVRVPYFRNHLMVVCGEMSYSDGDVFLVCTQDYIGMPVNKDHLYVCGHDPALAFELRKKYLDKYPTCLKGLW